MNCYDCGEVATLKVPFDCGAYPEETRFICNTCFEKTNEEGNQYNKRFAIKERIETL